VLVVRRGRSVGSPSGRPPAAPSSTRPSAGSRGSDGGATGKTGSSSSTPTTTTAAKTVTNVVGRYSVVIDQQSPAAPEQHATYRVLSYNPSTGAISGRGTNVGSPFAYSFTGRVEGPSISIDVTGLQGDGTADIKGMIAPNGQVSAAYSQTYGATYVYTGTLTMSPMR
jgi:hypothetical protein